MSLEAVHRSIDDHRERALQVLARLVRQPSISAQNVGVRDGRIYGRGTADNKGQLLAHVLAAGAWAEVAGRPPVNVKFVFEGEEESGSPSLADFVARNRDLLEADLVYISDGGV